MCLNSATACMEMILRVLGVGPGDEVITSAYTYTATASVTCHVGAKVVLVDTAPGSFEMDYDKLADAITEKTKVVIPVDLAGIVCDYDRIFAAVESRKQLFRPTNELQKAFGRVIVLADAAHAFGAKRAGRVCGEIADLPSGEGMEAGVAASCGISHVADGLVRAAYESYSASPCIGSSVPGSGRNAYSGGVLGADFGSR